MSDPDENTGSGTPAGTRDTSGGQSNEGEGATPPGARDEGRRTAVDCQGEEAGAGRRDEERDAPTDRQPDESGTPSGQRDAG
jgi:hypothetical protein